MAEAALDFLSSLLDEIALEGLDGITLPMLWVRLGKKKGFPLALDDDSKIFLWECIAVHKDIEIFELPKPRKFVPLYDRYKHIDSELGIVVEPTEKLHDAYPVELISDGDIRGSCSTYKTRKCITSDIRYDDVLLMSLSQVVEKWGESLVLVASPKARLLALIGTETNPLVDMSTEEYSLLERIGRSRVQGEVTQGEGGLIALKAPFCKQLHYYRKKLTLKGLVTKQLHYMKNRKGQATTGSLFHLTRFYEQRKTKMEFLMKCMCDILKEKPQHREMCLVMRQELGIRENTFKKLFYRPFQKWVKIVTLPYREFRPNATKKESFTNNGQERVVRVVQLLKNGLDGEKEEEEEEELVDGKETALPMNVHFDCSKVYHDIPLISQTSMLIKQAGPEGISSGDLGRILTLPRLDIRTLLRSLTKRGLVVTVLQDRGRQKVTKYISREFEQQNEAYSRVKEQEQLNKETMAENATPKQAKVSKRKNEGSLENGTNSKSKKVRFDDEVKIAEETPVENSVVSKKKKSNEITFQSIVSQVLEMQNSEVFTGKSPKLISLSEKPVTKSTINNSAQLTYRKLKRSNMILEYLKSVKFAVITDLQKYLIEKEKEEGYNFKLDKKSTQRLLCSLYNSKKIKIFKAVLKLDDEKAEIEFICDTSLTPSDPCIQVAIEQAKFKYFISISKERNKKNDQGVDQLIPVVVNNAKLPDMEKTEDQPVHQQKTFKSIYHVQPKFLRIKTLHQFLFYLVYQYEGDTSNKSTEPIVYHNSMSWKRFIPPLPEYGKEGWCFVADIFSRMPLSIFVKVVNLRHEIHNLAEYLEDENKANLLIRHLPQNMRNNLLNNRKYLFSTDDVLKGLCYMGLATFGPQVSKQKDQVFIFLHKNASLKDTTISTPGYIHVNSDLIYETRTYQLNSMIDVDNFWIDVETICFHTPLGKYSAVVGKTIAIIEACHKPELMEVVKHKNFDEVVDEGFIPGDSLGAAGFDSSLFMHTRRNWQTTSSIRLSEKLNSKSDKLSKIPSYSMQHLLKNKEVTGPESRSRLQRLSKSTLSLQKAQKKSQTENKKPAGHKKKQDKPLNAAVSKKRKRTKYRTVKLRKPKARTPYYDEKDKAAIEKMSKARCEWFAQEDSFLLLCKVASSFLDPTSRTLVVPYTVVRDLLHEHLPELSANKSSRACQRRLRYMMLNSDTTSNVAVFLGEAKQDSELVKEFEKTKPSKTKEDIWRELFTSVLKKLFQKFTLPASDRCKNVSLPVSMKEFNERFEIMYPRNVFKRRNHHKSPENEDEIKYSTLYSLIVSSMAINHSGTEWSYLLHKLYQEYPEPVLRSVVSRLRNEKIIAVKKKSNRKDLQRSLTSTFPYRFSVTYENAMVTKFPIKLFGESRNLLACLAHVFSEPGIELKGDIAPGYAATVLSLTLVNKIALHTKIPDQIILFDTSLSKEVRCNIVQRMMHTLSDKESLELNRLLNNEDESASNANNNVTVERNLQVNEETITNDTHISDEDNSCKRIEPNNMISEIQRSSNASRFALYLLRQELSQPPIERVQHSQDYIVLNSCQVFCNLKIEDENTQSFPVNPPEIIETIPEKEKTVEGRSLPQHQIILTDERISEIVNLATWYIPPGAFHSNHNFEDSLNIIYEAYSKQTRHDAKCIFDYIFKSKTLGVTEKEIWVEFKKLSGELSVFEHLHLFREAILVIRVGITAFTYVCIRYAESWVLISYLLPENCRKLRNETLKSKDGMNLSKNDDKHTSRKKSKKQRSHNKGETVLAETSSLKGKERNISRVADPNLEITEDDSEADTPEGQIKAVTKKYFDSSANLSKKVFFIPRTWRHPDGTLNKAAFVELLSTILGYIISSPGTSVTRVCERFHLILQPVQTLELIEILEKAYCVHKYFCKPVKKQRLFSKAQTLFVTEKPEPEDMDHLEPLPDAVCKIARLQEFLSRV